MAFNNGALVYDEDERSNLSGNGQNIFDKMEFFMEAGCLCDSRYLPVGHGVL